MTKTNGDHDDLRVLAPPEEQDKLSTGQMNNLVMRLIGIRDTLTTIPVPIIKRNIDMAIEELRAAVDPPPTGTGDPMPNRSPRRREAPTIRERVANFRMKQTSWGNNPPSILLRQASELIDELLAEVERLRASSGSPDSILDVKLWVHEWCQRHGYPGGQAAIGVDGAKELLRSDRLARIDTGETTALCDVLASRSLETASDAPERDTRQINEQQWIALPQWVKDLYFRWSASSRLETQNVLEDLLASASPRASAAPTEEQARRKFMQFHNHYLGWGFDDSGEPHRKENAGVMFTSEGWSRPYERFTLFEKYADHGGDINATECAVIDKAMAAYAALSSQSPAPTLKEQP